MLGLMAEMGPLTFHRLAYSKYNSPFQPSVLGAATFPLRSVLQSDTLSCSAAVEVKQRKERGSQNAVLSSSNTTPSSSSYQPSDTGSSEHEMKHAILGTLQVG